MKNETKDLKSIAQSFFTAYDAHDVEGMLAVCADGALGRYAPYGRNSVVPIRGGIDAIWRAFPQAVPGFRVKVDEMILFYVQENAVILRWRGTGHDLVLVPWRRKTKISIVPRTD